MPNPTAVPLFNSQTPTATNGYQNALWQTDGGVPVQQITVEVPNTGQVNPQTGSYSVAVTDCGKLLNFTGSSAVTFTLPYPSPFPQWSVVIVDNGSAALTIDPNSLNLDGSSSNVTIYPTGALFIYTDGSNYESVRLNSAVAKLYNIVSFLAGQPSAGDQSTNTGQILQWTCPGTDYLPNGIVLPANCGDSSGFCQVAPTASASYYFYKISSGSSPGTFGTLIASMTISTAGAFSFSTTSGSAYSFAYGDTLAGWAPSIQDATLASVGFTLACYHY